MLIYKQNSNILPLPCEALKCVFDRRVVRFGVYDEEILLRVGRIGYMLFTLFHQYAMLHMIEHLGTYADACKQDACHTVLVIQSVLAPGEMQQ